MSAPILKPIMAAEGPDAEILAAFERVRVHRAWLYSFEDTAADQVPEADIATAENESLADENYIWGTAAQTINGVICRLALSIPDLDQARWVERLLVEEGISPLLARRNELEGNARQIAIAIHDLQQIAAAGQTPPSNDPHCVWLDQYIQARATIDGWGDAEEDATYDATASMMNRLEDVILGVPALNREAVIAKLFILARINADGASPATEVSEALVREAEAVFGFKAVRNG